MRNEIINFFDELYPNAHCELTYNNDFELLIKIILSAQTTDKKVNEVTISLFEKYDNVIKLSSADKKEVENILKPLGLSVVKSFNIINCSKVIVEQYNCLIPKTHEELIKLNGVGNKTANVFLAVFYNVPTFAVDTHVKRVANRLGISKSSDVKKIENDLKDFFEKDTWIKLHHQLIFFGRYFCKAIKPNCDKCILKNNLICKK